MDDSFKDLEAELKALRPQRPGAHLLERVGADLAATAGEDAPASRPRYSSATNLNSWKWLGWRTAGLAAGVALMATFGITAFRQFSGSAPAPENPSASVAATTPAATRPAIPMQDDRYQPVAASNVLYDLKDEGLVKTQDDDSARRVRYRYLDTYTWKNPKTNASIKWSVPRDEIRLVSASLN